MPSQRKPSSFALLHMTVLMTAAMLGDHSRCLAAVTEYYFNYDVDSDGFEIVDQSGNFHDMFATFLGDFHYASLTAPVPRVGSARAFDVGNTIDLTDQLRRGGVTDPNPMDESDIIQAGGYTFETWIQRNANDGLEQHIWNPEGMHSIEILSDPMGSNQLLQFAIRGIAAWTLPVNSVLPPDEWHHLMAVMTARNMSGAVSYQLLVDGVQVGPTLAGNLFSSFTTFADRNEPHGIGTNEFGGIGTGFNGQLAYTRLSLGVVAYQESFAFARNIPGAPSGDFNQDETYDCLDIDALVAEIVAGANNLAFDLNGDLRVDGGDLSEWLAIGGAINLPSGNSYLVGDANLDGSVDGSDFGVWNSHKFTSAAAWCQGDFNADGAVDGSDFGLWNATKFQSADAIHTVPEPAILIWLFAWPFVAAIVCRHKATNSSTGSGPVSVLRS